MFAVGLLSPALVLGAVAVVAAVSANGGPKAPAVGQPTGGVHPVTPVLSARRMPASLLGTARSGQLAQALAPVLSSVQSRGCLAVALDGKRLVGVNADSAYMPASNTKLITASVALSVLGPTYRFTTEVRGTLGPGGTVAQLTLVGGGDPVLSTASYPASGLQTYPPTSITPVEQLADAVVAAGVKSVTTLVGDASRYDARVDNPNWGSAIANGDASPLSALMINDGYIGAGKTRLSSSTLGALQVFKALLVKRGVTVANVQEGTADVSPVVASIQSAPLSDLVKEMLTTSDNVTAELVLKEIAHTQATPGTTAGGIRVERARLAAWGIPTGGLVLSDGSGLSADNRLSCTTLVDLLAHVGTGTALFAGLPIAGRTGTLTEFFRGTPAEGVMRAKTGTLSVARSLSGFFPLGNGSSLEFSFLVNGGGSKEMADGLWNTLAAAFGAFPKSLAATQLGPLPATGA